MIMVHIDSNYFLILDSISISFLQSIIHFIHLNIHYLILFTVVSNPLDARSLHHSLYYLFIHSIKASNYIHLLKIILLIL
jgi:hypothetical protein